MLSNLLPVTKINIVFKKSLRKMRIQDDIVGVLKKMTSVFHVLNTYKKKFFFNC